MCSKSKSGKKARLTKKKTLQYTPSPMFGLFQLSGNRTKVSIVFSCPATNQCPQRHFLLGNPPSLPLIMACSISRSLVQRRGRLSSPNDVRNDGSLHPGAVRAKETWNTGSHPMGGEEGRVAREKCSHDKEDWSRAAANYVKNILG